MKVVSRLRCWLGRVVRQVKGLPLKQFGELCFWKLELQRYIDWYKGRIAQLHNVPTPLDEMKVKDYDLKENAIRTWFKVVIDRYPNQLLLSRDCFRGKRILDIGCGPIPFALGFTGCEVYGLDQLINGYKELGYPIDKYSERFIYVSGSAENMPFEDNFFDAVISVNALDHVDDFSAVAKEVCRVLRPGGILRIETHYHKPRLLEPLSLTDYVIVEHFGHLGIRKISERLFPDSEVKNQEEAEKLVVWGNGD